MTCRPECGACCIAPSISGPIPGMPDGKTAGVPCIHLDEHYRCKLFNSPQRPETCLNFRPEPDFCGKNRFEALEILTELEKSSSI